MIKALCHLRSFFISWPFCFFIYSNNCDMLKREVELIHKQKDEISRNWDSSLAELKEFAQFKAR